MRRIMFTCLCVANVATAAAASAQQTPASAPKVEAFPAPAAPPPSAAVPSVDQPAAPSALDASDAQLRAIIEAQQRRLDAQEAALAEQRRALAQLRDDLNVSRPSEQAQAPQPPAANTQHSAASFPGLTTSEEAAAALAWPGSFAVPGTATRLKISGFAEFNAVYDNNAITTPTSFVTNAIVTRNATPAQGENGQLNFSPQPSRLSVEWRAPLSREQRVKAFIAIDFFGNSSSAAPALRMREAYGEATNVLFGGDLLLGQTWSTIRDLLAVPGTLDFQGPNALFGLRHPSVRWTKKFAASPLTVKIAAEAPDKRTIENAQALSVVPDGTLALVWDSNGVNLQASLLVRSLRANVSNEPPISAFGWGASLAGRIYMPAALEKDFWTFMATYGRGAGGMLNDTPLDASYDPATNKIKPLPALAYTVGYQHWWTTSLYSVISYADVWQNTFSYQPGTAFAHTRYASLNLAFAPFPSWLFGLEGLYGSRKDKDGEQAWDTRGLFSSRFTF